MGLGLVAKLAEGAAIGTLEALINSRAILFLGIRIATVLEPAVTSSGTIFVLNKTIVKGPGQNFFIKSFAF